MKVIPEWVPAHPLNFKAGRGGVKVDRVVIHVADGTLTGTAAWFANASAKVSAHYTVGMDGRIIQSVSEKDTAHHSGSFAMNQRSIGIEHEGQPSKGAWTPSAAQVQASAELVASICAEYGIPVDRTRIIGHNEVDLTRKDRANCPGKTWPWDTFLAQVYRINNPAPVRPEPQPGHVKDGKEERPLRLLNAATNEVILSDGITLIEGTDKAYVDVDKLRASLKVL